jgi:hypothetical protein
MSLNDLQQALCTAGVEAEITGEFVVFAFPVPTGRHAGQTVKIGLTGADFPINPPGGVHVSPRLQHPGGSDHHPSPLGSDWAYWSRPYPNWPASSRSVGDYLAFLRQLFAQIAAAA